MQILNGTKLWASWAPAWAHLRGAPGEGDEGRCQEQCQGRRCGFLQPLCTTENHKVQEESFTSAHPPNLTSKCAPSCCLVCLAASLLLLRVVSVHADLIRGLILNWTLFFLLKSVPSWWELPSREAPFVVLFTRTSDPPEMRIMYKLMGKDGIKSTLV